MPGFKRWEVKDSENRWYRFDQQQKGSSCGPTCVKIVKESVSGAILSEDQMRTVTAIFKHDLTPDNLDGDRPSGQMAQIPESTHNWTTRGSNANDLIKTLKASPCPVPLAKKITDGLGEALLDATRNHPVLLFCRWHGTTAAHWIVSMGRLKSDPTRATILDPSYGLQYIDTTVYQNGFIKYKTKGQIEWAITT